MSIQQPSTAGLVHPEWVDGRRLWMDTPMRDLIHRLRFGDPVKGWEGDERLAVYRNELADCFEIWRLEDDDVYRFVARSAPGVAFDERVIDALLAWDRQRRKIGLHDEIVAQRERVDATREAELNEWVAEEMAPRLRHAIRKDM